MKVPMHTCMSILHSTRVCCALHARCLQLHWCFTDTYTEPFLSYNFFVVCLFAYFLIYLRSTYFFFYSINILCFPYYLSWYLIDWLIDFWLINDKKSYTVVLWFLCCQCMYQVLSTWMFDLNLRNLMIYHIWWIESN